MSRERNRHWQSMIAEIGNGILTIYFLVMMVIYPFYTKDGYRGIGNVKYYFFRNVSLATVGILLPVAVVSFWIQRKKISLVERYRRMSVTDWFVYGYLMAVLLSYLFTDFREEAFWGTDGWYMGLVSQLLFISIYFLFSRYFRWKEKMLYVVLLSSGLIFLLGILNRYSIYPISMYGQQPGFISTLGNINWFCGYWAVLFPLGIMFYWNSRGRWQRAAAGIYVVTGFISGVTQGSSSAYLALTGIFLLLFYLSFRNNKKMFRFLELGILFALSCQMARLFRYFPGFVMNYEDGLGIVLTDTNMTLYIGALAGVVYLLFLYLVKRRNYQIAQHRGIRKAVLILFTVIFAGYMILLMLNTCLPGGIFGLSDVQFFIFNDTWANSRGATWISGLRAYRNMSPLQKLAGVGSDCFAAYIYAVPELAERIYARFGDYRLTNAHNEWLTILVNQGALGLVCYAGAFLTAVFRFVKKAQIRPVLYLCAASILAYTVHNVVSFQQVLNAPFVFIMMGIGEGVCNVYNEAKETIDK